MATKSKPTKFWCIKCLNQLIKVELVPWGFTHCNIQPQSFEPHPCSTTVIFGQHSFHPHSFHPRAINPYTCSLTVIVHPPYLSSTVIVHPYSFHPHTCSPSYMFTQIHVHPPYLSPTVWVHPLWLFYQYFFLASIAFPNISFTHLIFHPPYFSPTTSFTHHSFHPPKKTHTCNCPIFKISFDSENLGKFLRHSIAISLIFAS